jgi:hypothetical protein
MMDVYATTIEHGFRGTDAGRGNLDGESGGVIGNHPTAGQVRLSDHHFRSLMDVQDNGGTRERDCTHNDRDANPNRTECVTGGLRHGLQQGN